MAKRLKAKYEKVFIVGVSTGARLLGDTAKCRYATPLPAAAARAFEIMPTPLLYVLRF